MEKTYSLLHSHTEYSNIRIIDSINKVEDLIDNAYEKGLKAIAITDHDTLSGHVRALKHYENYKKAFEVVQNNDIQSLTEDELSEITSLSIDFLEKINRYDFKVMLGNEIYIAKEGMRKETYEKGDKFYHFLLIAKDEVGHRQLRQLSSRAWERMFKRGVMRTPTYISDFEDIIKANPGHLTATTACLGGYPGTHFLQKGEEESKPFIESFLKQMVDIFGANDFFLEIQPSMQTDQINFNKFFIDNYWEDYNFVFTTDAHYLNEADKELHKSFLHSKDGDREVDEFYSAAFVMDYNKLKEFFKEFISAEKIEKMRENTLRISEEVKDYSLKKQQVVPSVPIDNLDREEYAAQNFNKFKQFINEKDYPYILKYYTSEDNSNRFFLYKIFDGMVKYIGTWEKEDEKLKEYLDRLEYEFEQLWEISITIKQPMSNYFLTMEKMIDIIWNDGDSIVGISRGSAAGFLINYLIGITQIDPLRQELAMPAWRFIHRDRPDLPDIDIDTEGYKRVKVFNKVREYFKNIGGEFVNVSTFGTEKAKSALRTASRGLGVDSDIVSHAISLIPNERGSDWTLQECYNGDGDKKAPIKKFIGIMNENYKLWELASKIEGLITSVGVHASGVIAVNEDFTKYNSLMKTSQDAVVSAYNLEDAEYMGGLKYDFLTINALDKIRTTMNLLLEDHQINWEGGLRDTYEKHLLPSNLEYDNKEMWRMAYEGKIVDLFQFDTPAGGQAIKSIKPEKLSELAIANSLMRLMKQEDASESPSDTYVRNKNNLKNWYYELNDYGLSPEEVKILEKYLLPLSGIADSQEAVMMMVMDDKIAGFNVVQANALRKAIAKKKKKILDATKDLFYSKGAEIDTSQTLLDYVWNVQIGRQIGYCFSILHTVGYSTIALQEMNLAHKFPMLYWNTACLTVNAGAVNEEDYLNLIDEDIIEVSDDEDIRGASKVQYGKVASAIGKFRNELGLRVDLPDINIARFGFTPDLETNSVVFGMKGISRIGDDLIKTIIEKRPYKSLEDFEMKMLKHREGKDPLKLISKDRVVYLIKAGAFDKIEKKPREEILADFVYRTCNLKTNINLNNFQKMIEYNIVPEEYDYQIRVYNFTKYLRKNKFKSYFILDDISEQFFFENGYEQSQVKSFKDPKLGSIKVIPQAYWDRIYQREMDKIRAWIKANKESLIKELNRDIVKVEMDKYASGNVLKWELESLNFYHTGHELTGVAEQMPIVISDVNDIPLEEVIGMWDIKGKTFPKYKIRHIIGTVLNKDKQKHLVTLSTPEGIINVKVYRNEFAKYDKVLSHYENGKKVVDEESFFEKGTFLLVSGLRRGDVFLPKAYKSLQVEPIMRLELTDEYEFVNAWGKRE